MQSRTLMHCKYFVHENLGIINTLSWDHIFSYFNYKIARRTFSIPSKGGFTHTNTDTIFSSPSREHKCLNITVYCPEQHPWCTCWYEQILQQNGNPPPTFLFCCLHFLPISLMGKHKKNTMVVIVDKFSDMQKFSSSQEISTGEKTKLSCCWSKS